MKLAVRRLRAVCPSAVCTTTGKLDAPFTHFAARFTILITAHACRAMLLFGLSSIAPHAFAADTPLPSFDEVRTHYVSSEARILDRRGQPIQEVHVDRRGHRLEWVPLSALSPELQNALINTEDKRFYQHEGVDWRAVAAAAWDNLFRSFEGRRPRGASTLSMQLAGLLDPALAMQGKSRTLKQKWNQTFAAQALEQRWSKPQILEAYLNLVYFRGDLHGLSAAAHGLFNKSPGALDEAESALLVALLRGPNAAPEQVALRACASLTSFANPPNCSDVQQLAKTSLAHLPWQARWNLAPALGARLAKQGGQKITTTLDADTQQRAQRVAEQSLTAADDSAAVLIIDTPSGDVLAWGSASRDPHANDQITQIRNADGMLLPFVVQQGIEQRRYTAASLIDEQGIHDGSSGAPVSNLGVSVRMALQSPGAAPLLWPTQGEVLPWQQRVQAFGFANRAAANLVVQLSLIDLTNAYRSLMNNGEWRSLRWLPETRVEQRRVGSAAAAYIVSDIMADVGARNQADSARPVWMSVHCDASGNNYWCVGNTARYTIGVRNSGNGAGLLSALANWRTLALELHRNIASSAPRAPAGVVRMRASFNPPVEADRDEWFLTGTQQALQQNNALPNTLPRITYPTHKQQIVLDGRLPLAEQPLRLQISANVPGMKFLLDQKSLPINDGQSLWVARAGHHQLALVDHQNRQIESLDFDVTVRGSAPAASASASAITTAPPTTTTTSATSATSATTTTATIATANTAPNTAASTSANTPNFTPVTSNNPSSSLASTVSRIVSAPPLQLSNILPNTQAGSATPLRNLPRISYPLARQTIALSANVQQMVITIANVDKADRGLVVQLDDERLPVRQGQAKWRPRAGVHYLSLIDAQGRQIESLSFEVSKPR